MTYAGITSTIGTGAGSAIITGNIIGFGAANGTGTTTISGSTNVFVGLNLTSNSTTAATERSGQYHFGNQSEHGKHRHRQRRLPSAAYSWRRAGTIVGTISW